MVINFYGEGCFKVQSGNFVLLTDPFDKNIGLTPPRIKSDIVLRTLAPFPFQNEEAGAEGTRFISGAGEYDINGVAIKGYTLLKESADKFLKTVYLVDIEGMRLCFLGHLSDALEPSALERLEEIDILFIPAGGEPFIEQKLAAKLARQIEPKIIIPSFFKIPSLKRKADDLKTFGSEFGGSKSGAIKEQDKLTIKKKDIEAVRAGEIVALKI